MENSAIENLGSKIIDGRAIAAQLFEDIAKQVSELSVQPLLCDVVVGNNPVSLSYVNIKRKRAQSCGIEFSLVQLPEASPEAEVITAIAAEQQKPNLCGLIVQLPLPENLDAEQILRTINPAVDVDGIRLRSKDSVSELVPPTAGAILHILDTLPLDLAKQQFVVLGQGGLVGMPITVSLRARGYNVDTVVEDTQNRTALLKSATVIITGVGKAGILTGSEVSEGVTVIDAGTSESGGSIVGDVDFASVLPKASFITPSPGGVGPVTVAKLLENVLKVAQARE